MRNYKRGDLISSVYFTWVELEISNRDRRFDGCDEELGILMGWLIQIRMVMVGMDRGGKYNILFEVEEVGLQSSKYYTLYQLFSSRRRNNI